jgi:hypothetical protein
LSQGTAPGNTGVSWEFKPQVELNEESLVWKGGTYLATGNFGPKDYEGVPVFVEDKQ